MSDGFSAITFNGPVTFNCSLVLGEAVGASLGSPSFSREAAYSDSEGEALRLLTEILEREEEEDDSDYEDGYDTQVETDDSDSDESLMEEGRAGETTNQTAPAQKVNSDWSEGLYPTFPVEINNGSFPQGAVISQTSTGIIVHLPIKNVV